MIPIPTIRRTLLCGVVLVAAACGSGGGALELAGGTDSLTFDSTPVGGLSSPRIVEWSNAGSDTVAIGDLRVTGAASGDFVVEEDLCGGTSVAPGRSCTAVVLFAPRQTGSRSASVVPATLSGAGPAVALRGEAIAIPDAAREPAGLVRAIPETLAFGEQPLGGTAGPLSVRLVNQREGPVQFSARLSGAAPGEYRVALDACSNEILAPGRACTIRILFSPAAEGLRSAELFLRDLNGPTTQIVPLVGIVPTAGPVDDLTPPPSSVPAGPLAVPLVVRPRALEFGVVTAATTSAPRTVRVENNSAANVVITSLRLAGASAPAFRIVGGDCERRTLVPSRICTVEVAFQPDADGPHAARLEAVTSAGVEPALVLLSGTGATP